MDSEQHVYPPSAAAVKNAWVSGMPAYQALVRDSCSSMARGSRSWRSSSGCRRSIRFRKSRATGF